MYNIYTVKGRNTGVLWQFKYDLNGFFVSFEVLEGELSETQRKWLFHFNRFPYSENAIRGWKAIKNFEISETPLEICFDAFWKAYDYKMGKATAQTAWKRLNRSDQLRAFLAIKPYQRFLSRKPGQDKLYAATFLNKRHFENDYKSAV